MIVSQLSYEITDPTIDSQMVTLKASGADTFFNITTPKFAAQAIKKAAEIGWKPVHYLREHHALEEVAARLGNTPTICRKCYVHPEVLQAYYDRIAGLNMAPLWETLLSAEPERSVPYVLRPHQPGDIGWAIQPASNGASQMPSATPAVPPGPADRDDTTEPGRPPAPGRPGSRRRASARRRTEWAGASSTSP